MRIVLLFSSSQKKNNPVYSSGSTFLSLSSRVQWDKVYQSSEFPLLGWVGDLLLSIQKIPVYTGMTNTYRHPERDSASFSSTADRTDAVSRSSSFIINTNTISDSLYSLDSFWLDQYIHPAFGTPQEGKKYKPPFSPPCHGDKYKNIILNLIRSASAIQQIARYSFFVLFPLIEGARGSCIYIQALSWRVSFQNL